MRHKVEPYSFSKRVNPFCDASTVMTDSCTDHAAYNAFRSMAIIPSMINQKALVHEDVYKVHCLDVSHTLKCRMTYIERPGCFCRFWLVENAVHKNGNNAAFGAIARRSIVVNTAAQSRPIPTRPGPMGQCRLVHWPSWSFPSVSTSRAQIEAWLMSVCPTSPS
jgi:hypothetical protein